MSSISKSHPFPHSLKYWPSQDVTSPGSYSVPSNHICWYWNMIWFHLLVSFFTASKLYAYQTRRSIHIPKYSCETFMISLERVGLRATPARTCRLSPVYRTLTSPFSETKTSSSFNFPWENITRWGSIPSRRGWKVSREMGSSLYITSWRLSPRITFETISIFTFRLYSILLIYFFFSLGAIRRIFAVIKTIVYFIWRLQHGLLASSILFFIIWTSGNYH